VVGCGWIMIRRDLDQGRADGSCLPPGGTSRFYRGRRGRRRRACVVCRR
jgi:hypothetical protein